MNKKTHIVRVWDSNGREMFLQEQLFINYVYKKHPSDATRFTLERAEQLAVKYGGEIVPVENFKIWKV